MDREKFVAMGTWVCKCGERYRFEIEKQPHNEFDIACCIPCNMRDGQEKRIEHCPKCRPL